MSRKLKTFSIRHVQAVWEESIWEVKTTTRDKAESLFNEGKADLICVKGGDSVAGIDSEMEITEC